MSRPQHRVSLKAAIFSADYSRVIVMNYTWGGCGLPGGHLELDEALDDAVQRELQEEIGDVKAILSRQSFWQHEDGRVILGYVGGVEDESVPLASIDPTEQPQWVHVSDIASGTVNIGSYKDFVLRHAKEQRKDS